MRAYFFGHFQLSSIQQGIQALHVVSRMHRKYQPGTPGHDALIDWADNHETAILLKGGNCAAIEHILAAISLLAEDWEKPEGLPFSDFCESVSAINGARTCVGLILPEEVYGLSPAGKEDLRRKARAAGFFDNLGACMARMDFNCIERAQLLILDVPLAH